MNHTLCHQISTQLNTCGRVWTSLFTTIQNNISISCIRMVCPPPVEILGNLHMPKSIEACAGATNNTDNTL